ncbi:RNA methyltransferase, TrmH family, group 3 [Desulfofarcimen acetoxidans DSM 771]|uniref:RNA methyltransferase, TrmH family, group 3 n=1 Tax=Desulfofarcimen acetoxidans (strain ATCC 49208 / DSM 771 / KCTC 5769 / VKM B-1644 / 5575) TaxID=485916 RepID=C8W3W6_DESAS|nr:RNA methyltransferase, TrmH family, group 3 [Desulfofarcimen acetoxidans DSM 771]
MKNLSDVIVGRNPVKEALKSQRPINKVLVAKGKLSGSLAEICSLARQNGIPVQEVDRTALEKISAEAVHQGVAAYAAAKEYVELEDILARAGEQEPFIIMLDEITDPHNLGAIIRTADAAGVHGVVVTRRRSALLTPVVAKSSAGAVEYVPVARVTNLVQSIKILQENGIWVAGADMEGDKVYWEAPLSGPIAIVIGGEGKGLGRLVKEKCDFLVRLPMQGKISSLNASVATALLAYEVVRQRSSG